MMYRDWSYDAHHNQQGSQGGGDVPDPAPMPSSQPVSTGSLEQQLLGLINADRAAAGVGPLMINGSLDMAADTHTAWMLATDSFSCTGAGGISPSDCIGAAGYSPSAWGENIAWVADGGALDAADVVRLHETLMNSPEHRDSLLSVGFTEIGLALI